MKGTRKRLESVRDEGCLVRFTRPCARGFVESALRKRRRRRPAKPPVSVASLPELLETAGHAFPLVTIHLEIVDPRVCWIGGVRRATRGRLTRLPIDPDGLWWEETKDFRLSEITRVDFGTGYEEALHRVGGRALGE